MFDPSHPNHHLMRLEFKDGSPWGWQAKFRVNGVERSRFFRDSLHGGSRKAMLEARKWRDEEMAKGDAGTTVDGVYRKGDDYVATWYADGRMQHGRFSVKEYGDDGAFFRAMHARRQAVKGLPQQTGP
jgi:hypothetical protein